MVLPPPQWRKDIGGHSGQVASGLDAVLQGSFDIDIGQGVGASNGFTLVQRCKQVDEKSFDAPPIGHGMACCQGDSGAFRPLENVERGRWSRHEIHVSVEVGNVVGVRGPVVEHNRTARWIGCPSARPPDHCHARVGGRRNRGCVPPTVGGDAALEVDHRVDGGVRAPGCGVEIAAFDA